MKIAIIGSSGFIGGNLIKEFKTDSSINILKIDKNEGSYKDTIEADVRCLSSLKNAIPQVDTIINLAAEHKDNVKPKKLYYDVNVQGAVNVCKLAEFRKINRIIFTSSVAVYGFQNGICGESVNPNPFNEYGKTKLSAEKIYTKWFEKDPSNRSLIILRPTVVFGEGNRGNVYNLINQINSGFFLMIGKGENIKSMAYVNNLTQFIVFCANFRKGFKLYNYVDKPDFNMNKLVQLISTELNKKLLRLRIPRSFGLLVGKIFDFFSTITGINFPVSAVRIQKFCSNSSFSSSVLESGFKPKFLLKDAFVMTITKEFKKKREI